MFDPGDVVVSSPVHHANRPDVIVGLLTSQVASIAGPTDWSLQDWKASGLRRPAAFRSFLYTTPRAEVIAHIGRLSQADWDAVQACLKSALGPL